MSLSIPDLYKRRWFFEPMWMGSLERWCVTAAKYSWGIRKSFYDADWDAAHEKARAWAEAYELDVNAPETERNDTERCPAMVAGDAAE